LVALVWSRNYGIQSKNQAPYFKKKDKIEGIFVFLSQQFIDQITSIQIFAQKKTFIQFFCRMHPEQILSQARNEPSFKLTNPSIGQDYNNTTTDI
jgi:hypothetical protein